jgi:hypothetical protein
MISEKIRPHHLERKALLYVRQSSVHQVQHNCESSALQYAMQGRLRALGWATIEVIDDDLGRSAAGTALRALRHLRCALCRRMPTIGFPTTLMAQKRPTVSGDVCCLGDCVAKPGRFVGDCSLEFGVPAYSALSLRELRHRGVGRVGQGNC